MIQLGNEARDSVTGFQGIVTSITKYLTGCDRIVLIMTMIKQIQYMAQDVFEYVQGLGYRVFYVALFRDMAKRNMYYPEHPREFEKVVQSFGANAFIFDIDGTLAYMTDRSPYDYSKVSTDGCYDDVADMAHILKMNGNKIIICSGRKDDCREETIKWLDDMGIEYDILLMRKSGDNRKDSIVKYELLVNEIIPHYYIQGVFDDRDQVVKMWREAGLRCYQVNYGNF